MLHRRRHGTRHLLLLHLLGSAGSYRARTIRLGVTFAAATGTSCTVLSKAARIIPAHVVVLLHLVMHHHLVLLRCVHVAHHHASISALLPAAIHVCVHAAGAMIQSKHRDRRMHARTHSD